MRIDHLRTRFLPGLLALALLGAKSTLEGVRAAYRRPAFPIPPSSSAARVAGEIAVDEFLLVTQAFTHSVPSEEELRRNLEEAEVAAAELAHLAPGDLHPRAVPCPEVTVTGRERLGHRWDLLTFRVPPHLPGALVQDDGWISDPALTVAHARVMRHANPRPWVIVVHGAKQGGDFDLWILRARHLHERLGFNVVLPVLPLHGPRQSHAEVPGFDVMTNVSSAMVAVQEIRLIRRWIAEQSSEPVGIVGVSLGGYLTALTAGVEPNFDVVVAAIPFASMHGVIAGHLESWGGAQGRRLASLLRSDPVIELERFIDPRRFEPAVPPQRRHVIAGSVDRVTTPRAALELAEHWRPLEVEWYDGGHVGHGWSKILRGYIDSALLQLYEDDVRQLDPQSAS